MGESRQRRVRSLAVAGLVAATLMVGGAWTWPSWPPKPPKPPVTVPTTPAGRAHLEFQGPDPLVIESGPVAVSRSIVVKNTGPVDDSGGFSVSVSGSANVSLSTGTCSRPLKKGATCTMTIGVRKNSQAGTSTITVQGGPKSIGDSMVVKVVRP